MTKNNPDIKRKKGYTLIRLPGTITTDSIFLIENRIESVITKENNQIALDLSSIQSVYSILITLILHIENQVSQAEGMLYLVNVHESCYTQLKTINLDKVFQIYEKEGDLRILLGD